jgi:multicomponent Na+:H+ antiporter subunit G
MEFISSLLMLAGSFFFLISALGVVKFPDVFTRMHAASKSSSLGIALVLAGVCFHFQDWIVFLKGSLIVFFIFLTAPVAAHILGRAAFLTRAPVWKKSVLMETEELPQPNRQTE